jgi:hypothetical protein
MQALPHEAPPVAAVHAAQAQYTAPRDPAAAGPGREPIEADRIPERAIWSVPVLHTTGLFVTMRTTEAVLWPEPFADTRPKFWLENYEQAFTRPPLFDGSEPAFEWDHDAWTINVVGHGLLGSELYFRPRRCGATALEALAFAASASAVWEYAFEANGVRPSALDLAFTPIAGLVLGEARYLGWSAAGAIRSRSWRDVVRTILDPLGQLERAVGAPC